MWCLWYTEETVTEEVTAELEESVEETVEEEMESTQPPVFLQTYSDIVSTALSETLGHRSHSNPEAKAHDFLGLPAFS